MMVLCTTVSAVMRVQLPGQNRHSMLVGGAFNTSGGDIQY